MNGVQTRFKCKLDVKRCKRFVFPPSSLLPRSNALKTKAIRYFQTDRTLTRIVSPPLNAQTRKQREDAKREAWKKERQEKKALEAQQDSVSYVQAINALKNGSFVLEADNVVFRNGIMRFVSSNTNYVEVNDGQGIIQTAFTNFVYNWSPNGLGGVTVQGNVNGISMRQDKDGNVYYNYGINGIAVSATVSIVLTGGTNQASVTINPNFSGNTLTMNGYLVPYNESSVFQGTTW